MASKSARGEGLIEFGSNETASVVRAYAVSHHLRWTPSRTAQRRGAGGFRSAKTAAGVAS